MYRPGYAGAKNRQLAWFDRSGNELGKVGDAHSADIDQPDLSLSPDGRHGALGRITNGNYDVWLVETTRGVLSRFTSDAAVDFRAVWSANGSRIFFASNRNGQVDLYQKLVIGAVNEEPLLTISGTKHPVDSSPDGRFLLYNYTSFNYTFLPGGGNMGWDIWALPLDGDRKPFPVVQTNFDERDAQFSPDGKWIAYQSNESGRFEIYVSPFLVPVASWGQSPMAGLRCAGVTTARNCSTSGWMNVSWPSRSSWLQTVRPSKPVHPFHSFARVWAARFKAQTGSSTQSL